MADGYVGALSANGSGTTSVVLTLTSTPNPAGLIVVPSRISASGAFSSISDSRGNTWQFNDAGTSGPRAMLCWTTQDKAPLVVNDTVTISAATAVAVNAQVYEFLPCFPAEDNAAGVHAAANTTLACPASSRLINGCNDILISAATFGSATSAWSVTNGYVIKDSATATRVLASQVVHAVGFDMQLTWSWTGSQPSSIVSGAFRLLVPAQPAPDRLAVARAASW